MSLSNRERSLLVLDKRVFGVEVFISIDDWIDCKDELKHHHAKFYDQAKARKNKKTRAN